MLDEWFGEAQIQADDGEDEGYFERSRGELEAPFIHVLSKMGCLPLGAPLVSFHALQETCGDGDTPLFPV